MFDCMAITTCMGRICFFSSDLQIVHVLEDCGLYATMMFGRLYELLTLLFLKESSQHNETDTTWAQAT